MAALYLGAAEQFFGRKLTLLRGPKCSTPWKNGRLEPAHQICLGLSLCSSQPLSKRLQWSVVLTGGCYWCCFAQLEAICPARAYCLAGLTHQERTGSHGQLNQLLSNLVLVPDTIGNCQQCDYLLAALVGVIARQCLALGRSSACVYVTRCVCQAVSGGNAIWVGLIGS